MKNLNLFIKFFFWSKSRFHVEFFGFLFKSLWQHLKIFDSQFPPLLGSCVSSSQSKKAPCVVCGFFFRHDVISQFHILTTKISQLRFKFLSFHFIVYTWTPWTDPSMGSYIQQIRA